MAVIARRAGGRRRRYVAGGRGGGLRVSRGRRAHRRGRERARAPPCTPSPVASRPAALVMSAPPRRRRRRCACAARATPTPAPEAATTARRPGRRSRVAGGGGCRPSQPTSLSSLSHRSRSCARLGRGLAPTAAAARRALELRLGLRVDSAQQQQRLAHNAHHSLSRVGSTATSVAGTSQGRPLQKKNFALVFRLSSLVAATTRRRRSASHRRRRWRRRRPPGPRRGAVCVHRRLLIHAPQQRTRGQRASCRARDRSQCPPAAAAGMAASPRVALSEAGRAAARAWRGHGLFCGNHGGRRTAHRADLGGRRASSTTTRHDATVRRRPSLAESRSQRPRRRSSLARARPSASASGSLPSSR